MRLLERIGAGGMGSVWVAEHLGLATRVAVKFITAEAASHNERALVRFKREAAAAAKIRSPHVVQVLDHGVAFGGLPYIAMELLEGESLQDRLKRERALGLRETAIITAQTAQVLALAHGLGVVHRDIKPANLFLLRSGYEIFTKVLDFGIARHVDAGEDVSVTATGAMLGSPLYMSPEQVADPKSVDGRADLWSLSVVIYQLLTGRPCFVGQTMGQVMIAIINRTYRPARTLRPELPEAIDAFFARAFAPAIEERFARAEDLASAFLRVAEGALDARAQAAMPTFEATAPAPPAPAPPPISGPTLASAGTLAPAVTTVSNAPRGRGLVVAALAAAVVLAGSVAGALALWPAPAHTLAPAAHAVIGGVPERAARPAAAPPTSLAPAPPAPPSQLPATQKPPSATFAAPRPAPSVAPPPLPQEKNYGW